MGVSAANNQGRWGPPAIGWRSYRLGVTLAQFAVTRPHPPHPGAPERHSRRAIANRALAQTPIAPAAPCGSHGALPPQAGEGRAHRTRTFYVLPFTFYSAAHAATPRRAPSSFSPLSSHSPAAPLLILRSAKRVRSGGPVEGRSAMHDITRSKSHPHPHHTASWALAGSRVPPVFSHSAKIGAQAHHPSVTSSPQSPPPSRSPSAPSAPSGRSPTAP